MNYNRRLVKAHQVRLFLALLILTLAGRVLADGRYQWTEDRKRALVWNNDPKPGDCASWSGNHDDENYATGPGTLSWFRVDRGFATGSNIPVSRKKIPISSYSGTMVRGKFDGVVSTVDHGKSYHATFADGQRKGRWMAGPAVAKAQSVESTSAKNAPAAAEAATADEPKIAEEKKSDSTETTTRVAAAPTVEESDATNQPPSPGYGPANTSESTNPKSSPPLIAQASSEETPQHEALSRKATLAPGAVRAIDRPGSEAVKKSQATRTKSEKTEKPKAKATPAESSEEAPQDVIAQSPAEGPHENPQPPKLKSESAANNAPPVAEQTPVDDSIRALMGPPSSLRSGSPKPETTAPAANASPPAAEAASSAPDGPKLTAVEAMDIADIEARTRGYDLGDYELPKAEYNASNDSWSVSYASRQPDKSKKFSVSVQDKSGKAEVKK